MPYARFISLEIFKIENVEIDRIKNRAITNTEQTV